MKEEVWFDYNGIVNIIALHSVQDHFNFKVSYSHLFRTDRNTFVVIKPDNSKMKFTILQNGLYYTDTPGLIGRPSKVGVFNQVASVKKILTKYTKRSVNQAQKAQRFQVMFNNINTKKLLHIVNNNMVKGLPITRQDVKLTKEIYGQNIYALKRKTVNRNVDHVVAPVTSILKQILNKDKNIMLYIVGTDPKSKIILH